MPKLKAFEEPGVRVRWEPPAVITQLIQAISQDCLKGVALFVVSTGMRADEILSLTWSQVDIVRRTAWVTAAERNPNGREPCRSTMTR
ncbi:tyrosine-type recombinase/integrase [Pigmentiphaga humi]|uniref:tyrosine-type recombinase/integrase n=1 Tax=Pigmentiphaga humi TaxID=2478468 RepID=UPI0013580CFC|nr:tyrosine-type recombinase/integrase [Pigmentiphaga humi]